MPRPRALLPRAIRFDWYSTAMAVGYDADTTRLFDEDPDLVRLRRHVAFSGAFEDIGSPVGAWLLSRGTKFDDFDEFGISARVEAIDENELNLPLLHGKG